jgi:hypothetical protein
LKIGILTFHDGPNHGAFLQVYAMYCFVRALVGDKVCIINYKNRQHAKEENWLRSFRYRNPFAIVGSIHKHFNFALSRRLLNLTKNSKDPLEVKKTRFDLVIVGSDVVWNYNLFGYDDLFFGGANAEKIISYAASFGWVKATDNHPKEVAKGLQRFSSISVRDDNSQIIIEKLLGLSVPIVLDPTFLISWREHERHSGRIRRLKPFLLIYAYRMSAFEIDATKAYAEKHGLITLAVGYRQKWCDKVWMDVGPFEWLALYQRARHVVTGTFHGSIFSILYQKSFSLCMNEKIEARVMPLLNLLGATDVIIQKERDIERIEFAQETVNQLTMLIQFSQQWLKENLDIS